MKRQNLTPQPPSLTGKGEKNMRVLSLLVCQRAHSLLAPFLLREGGWGLGSSPPSHVPPLALPDKIPSSQSANTGEGIMGEKYLFNITRLTKHYGKKEVLKDISLYFYFGAKIGVIGDNGSGKSTLLRIMAGV